MRGAPVSPLAKYEATPGEELEDVVARLEDLALKRLTAAHNVTHSLVALARDSHDDELTRSIIPREIRGIPLIVFALHAGPFRVGATER